VADGWRMVWWSSVDVELERAMKLEESSENFLPFVHLREIKFICPFFFVFALDFILFFALSFF
jgi:hypothetical protein